MSPEGAAYLRVQPARALSVRQPWAWAILNAGKRVENRSQRTHIRGDFLIHAAKGCTAKEYAAAARWMAERGLAIVPGILSKQAWIPGLHPPVLPPLASLPRGGIVGQARLVDCLSPSTRDASVWHMPALHGWVLEDVQPLPFRKLAGSLGFFTVNGAGERA